MFVLEEGIKRESKRRGLWEENAGGIKRHVGEKKGEEREEEAKPSEKKMRIKRKYAREKGDYRGEK